MAEYYLTSPLKDEDISHLRVGDIVYLSGMVHTARDGVYKHMLLEGNKPPIDLARDCNVSIQASPAGTEVSPGQYEVSSLSATASFRYAHYMPKLLKDHGIKAVIGKAGMPEQVYRDVFSQNGAICLSTMGYGLGAIYGRGIKKVHSVHWAELLGVSEAMWVLLLENLGPLLVEGDVEGNSYFKAVNEGIDHNLKKLYEELDRPL